MRLVLSLPVVFAAAALLAFGAQHVLGDTQDVSGSRHDVTAPDVPVCTSCHLPRDEEDELLWANEPDAGGQLSDMKALCLSCHDGTVTWKGMYAFNTARSMHVTEPGVRGHDCDLCHDPHDDSNDRFLKIAGGANFCRSCHEFAGAGNHPVDVDSRDGDSGPRDSTWDPENGDFSGTRLWDAEGTGPGQFVKCLSCHTTHGGEPDTAFNTMPFESSHDAFLPLCLNCHFGWGTE